MKMCKVAVSVGTRPEIIKMQPVLKELKTRHNVDLAFIHTGQHYDYNMSSIFIKELDLEEPDLFLNVKSDSPGAQIGKIIGRGEQALKKLKPSAVIVQGDTNSTLGIALAGSRLKLPVGHVEAGCRSFNKEMPEEQNRVLVADIATHHFAPTENCKRNLLHEGVAPETIFLTGHPLVDLLNKVSSFIDDKSIRKHGLSAQEYYFVTLHREENVSNKDRLESILKAMHSISGCNKVIFPIHPHTRKNIRKYRFTKYLRKSIVIEPVGYMEGLAMIKNAFTVLTDSGGIQQEAAILGTPCLTMRNETEWIETVQAGLNFLAGTETEKILNTARKIYENRNEMARRFRKERYLFGRPPVSKKIADIIETMTATN